MAFKTTYIKRQLIKPARRGFTETSASVDDSASSTSPRMRRTTLTVLKCGCEPSPSAALGDTSPVLPRRGFAGSSASVCGSASSTSPRRKTRARTSGTTTTILKCSWEPSPPAALGDASPVLPVRCRRGRVSKEMEEDTPQPSCEKKGKGEKMGKSNPKASASPLISMGHATSHHNVRVPRARKNLGSVDISCSFSYSSQRADLTTKRQGSSHCLLSSALSPISEDPKKIIIALGCEDGENPAPLFKKSKMTKNSLPRPSAKRDVVFGKHGTGASSPYVGRNEQRKRLLNSEARRQLIGKSVLGIFDEADEIIEDSSSSLAAEESMEKSGRRNSEVGKNQQGPRSRAAALHRR